MRDASPPSLESFPRVITTGICSKQLPLLFTLPACGCVTLLSQHWSCNSDPARFWLL